MIPFASKSEAQTEPPAFSIASPKRGPSPLMEKGTSWKKTLIVSDPLNKASMKSLVREPTKPTEMKYLNPMTIRKMGSARKRFKTTLSNLSVMDSGIFFCIQLSFLTLVTKQYRWSAMICSLSLSYFFSSAEISSRVDELSKAL